MIRASLRYIVGLSLLGLLLTIVMLGLQLGAMRRLGTSHHASDYAICLQGDLEHTLRLLVDAETGQRGFLLTGKDSYLEPYRRALRELPQQFQALDELLDEHPDQKAGLGQLEGLAKARLDELRETITLDEAGKPADAIAIVKSDRGEQLLDAFRALEATMVGAEDAKVVRQDAAGDRAARGAFIASVVAAIMILGDGVLLLLIERETRRRQGLRIADLEGFAGRVAHDIRSPLTAVKLSIEAAKRRLTEGAVPANLERAGRGIDQANLLVEGLLTFARAGAPPEGGAESDVGSVIRDVVAAAQGAARQRGIDLEVEESAAAKVACSPGVLTSMVSNLIDNAVKHMGEAPTKRVTVRARGRRSSTHIEVLDTGPGVPRHLRATIFDPHVRGPGTKEPGLGLGLATVRRLAEAHGGSAGVEPNPPSGSVFWIDVPNVPGPQSAGAPSTARAVSWIRALMLRLRRTPLQR